MGGPVVVEAAGLGRGPVAGELDAAGVAERRHPHVVVTHGGDLCPCRVCIGRPRQFAPGPQVLAAGLRDVENGAVPGVEDGEAQPATLRHARDAEQHLVLEGPLVQPIAGERARVLLQVQRRRDGVAQDLSVDPVPREQVDAHGRHSGEGDHEARGEHFRGRAGHPLVATHEDLGVDRTAATQPVRRQPHQQAGPQRGAQPGGRGCAPHSERDAHRQPAERQQQRPHHRAGQPDDAHGCRAEQQAGEQRHGRRAGQVTGRSGDGEQIHPALEDQQHQPAEGLQRGDDPSDHRLREHQGSADEEVGPEQGREPQRGGPAETGRDKCDRGAHRDADEGGRIPAKTAEGGLKGDDPREQQRPGAQCAGEREGGRALHTRLLTAGRRSARPAMSRITRSPTLRRASSPEPEHLTANG